MKKNFDPPRRRAPSERTLTLADASRRSHIMDNPRVSVLSLLAGLCALTLLATAPACTGGEGDDDDDDSVIDGPSVCALGLDCPIGQGCGSDGLCHEDGECTDAADCTGTDLCYNGGNDDPAGFCASERPETDPYCRSDGEGACRLLCNSDGTCNNGGDCEDGFCTYDDECTTADDCTPNHICEEHPDYGIGLCAPDPDPTCVDIDGVCRLACEEDLDCLWGGGCDGGYCYASNECDPEAPECEDDLVCFEDDTFGGLCGPPRDK
jgi:hypothetical protein